MPPGSISVLVTAPHGIDACVYLDGLLSAADGEVLEIVVADGASEYVDRSGPGLRHVRASGCGIQGLIAEGIAHSSGEWIVITEDHCRPLPNFIENYRDAIRRHPDVDLFSGAVDNLTSASPWAFAVFMYGLHEFWPKIARPPSAASNANLMVRRSAILASELACEGGAINITVPRLIKSGRYQHCPTAIVDHVLELSLWQAVRFEFDLAADAMAVYRELSPSPVRLVGLCRDFLYNAVIAPLRISRQAQGTSQSGPGAALRLLILGIAAGLGAMTVDLRRLMRGHATGAIENQEPMLRGK